MKKISCIIISVIITLSLCSCMHSTFLHIESGFSEKLTDLLSEKYELNIPESAEFVSGYFDRSFQDPSVTVYFTVSENDVENLFGDNWQKDSTNNDHTGLFPELSFEPKKNYIYTKELYTVLICSEAENGIVECAFIGRHPGGSFK